MTRSLAVGVLTMLTVLPRAAFGGPIGYVQTNLASDVPGLAAHTDPNLRNPWGMSFSATSPFWISDQVTNETTLYSGTGALQALVVSVPGGPTGQAFAGGQGFHMQGTGASAVFVFATLSGTIDAWSSGTAAVVQYTATDSAVYTGLALDGPHVYAADARNGKIDVFDTSFAPTTVAGTFTDPGGLPAGFTPYNIQNIGGELYVEYAHQGAPGGIVDIFDTDGHFVRRFSSDPVLDQPWGIVLAPTGFGDFASDILVGNFGNGLINAFDATSGAFEGTVADALGQPIVNSGLWALAFRAPGSGFDPNALYFTAGINNEVDGLFGELQVAAPMSSEVPEPASLLLLTTGLISTGVRRRWRTRRTAA